MGNPGDTKEPPEVPFEQLAQLRQQRKRAQLRMPSCEDC